ncbi:MAG: peptide chain release factor 2 [Patescibacteria group bacterium]
MIDQILKNLSQLRKKIELTRGSLDQTGSEKELNKLEEEMNQPDFWLDREKAAKRSTRAEELRGELKVWNDIQKSTAEAIALAEEAKKESDISLTDELGKAYKKLVKDFSRLEFKLLLNGPYDEREAILAIHAGTGGVDAQDWAEMLMRMYLRFCEKKKWPVSIIHRSTGNEAGIKSAMLAIQGRHAFGYLKAEAGVHRLVRISPYDAEKMRHTSFALVEVIPDLGEDSPIDIKESELRIDVFRASGHGGQSVNTTDSAVRAVHLPTGITVNCQNERSQSQNKATAIKILKSKLVQQQEKERQAVEQKLRGEYQSAEWGNQIRSYVLQPYTMVKDHRTKYETSDVANVLNGNIDDFIEEYLKSRVKK